ncbi:glucose-1-phosphate cytidylyltransferase [Candidatus Pseudothioglobus sp. Uisw_041]|jgi:glucose-1-phosphate cytidylyltransferase|uniref:glucose-1-phosphate cytidylyltransferase n=1 Tax=Candidatus Pseudothioglobus sp. Uisw_041 TaxID=3230996 RepID=UPI003A8849EA
MKAVILAGGLGTRLSEETTFKPKPMIEIGGKPVLWHIMKMYSSHGINDFVICCGYKGYVIKEYFANYFLHQSDVTFEMKSNSMEVHHKRAEPWTVTLIDTGEKSMTGGRLLRVSEYIKNEEAFCFTYGDGVSDIDITKLIKFHKAHGKDATLTATYSPARFGALEIQDNKIMKFTEKPIGDGALINGGFFVLSPNVLDRISGDDCIWEQAPLKSLSTDLSLMAFKHEGFWQPMDTQRDMAYLQELWDKDEAPWKTW